MPYNGIPLGLLDTRFVNVTGDTMTDDLHFTGPDGVYFRDHNTYIYSGGAGSLTLVATSQVLMTTPTIQFGRNIAEDIVLNFNSFTSDGTLTWKDTEDYFLFGDNVTISGDLTITGDDLFMNINTANYFLMADGTNYNPTSPASVRAGLDLEIGTDLQAWDTQLDDIAALAVTDGNFIVGDGTNWVAENGATARTSLGLIAGGTGDIWVEKAGDTMTGALEIDLTLKVTGHVGIGISTSEHRSLGVYEIITHQEGAKYGMVSDMYHYPVGALSDTAVTVGHMAQAQWFATTEDGGTHGYIFGIQGNAIITPVVSAGDLNTAIGVWGRARHRSTATVTTAIGVKGDVFNDAAGASTGDITSAYSLMASAESDKATGVIGTRYGLYIEDIATSGNSTNQYGIYCPALVGADTDNLFIKNVSAASDFGSGDIDTTGTITTIRTNSVAGGTSFFRVTGLQVDGTAMTGTLRGAYIDVSNGSTAATGTIRAMELKARTEAPGDTGNDVTVLEGLSISADSKDHSVTTMRGIEAILDGTTGGTITTAVGIRIANNLQANKATTSYGLQIYRDSFDYTADIQLSNGDLIGSPTGDSRTNTLLIAVPTTTSEALILKTTDDNATKNLMELQDSNGAEVAHINSDGNIKLFSAAAFIEIEDDAWIRIGSSSALDPQFTLVAKNAVDAGRMIFRYGAGGSLWESTDGSVVERALELAANHDMILQSRDQITGSTISFGFKVSTNKGSLYNKLQIIGERTGSNVRGKLHLAVNNADDNTSATLSDARLTVGTSLQINPGLLDYDTIISGDTEANLFKVDAGLDAVGIAIADPDAKLEIYTAAAASVGLHIKAHASQSANIFNITDSSDGIMVSVDSGGNLYCASGGSLQAFAFDLIERAADPAEPPEGTAIMWMSDGTSDQTGVADGDVVIASQAGGNTTVTIIHDNSAAAAWVTP